LLDDRGMSLRQARIRTGVDIDTLGRMRSGDVPRMDKVIEFARGFGQDANLWLELAGYQRVESLPSESPAEQLLEGLDRLAADFPDQHIPVPSFSGGVRSLTPEKVCNLLATFRRMAEEGRHPKKSSTPPDSSRRLRDDENKQTRD
jgi:hypothetical protein